MDVWFHSEIPYPFVPAEVLERADSVRGSLPNRYCDPRIAADLFEECLDEFLLCDERGLNVVAIEHHAGINSLLGANPLLLGILARQTRKARILSLGTLISLRPDPVRVAEEYATADVISRGRLEIGFVKSGGSEMASNNANPVNNIERYWEAIDLVTKALTHHDGPFSWEGKHFTHRHVNIWPRPFQQPLPRLWAATGDPETSAEVGRRGMVNVLVLRGVEGTRRAWASYRKAREDAGLPRVDADHFGYAALLGVGDTHEEGVRLGEKLLVPQHQPQVGAAVQHVPAGRDASRARASSLSNEAEGRHPGAGGGLGRRQCQRAHRARRRRGHETRYSFRRQSRHRVSADHELPRRGRRLRTPGHDRAVGFHDPR